MGKVLTPNYFPYCPAEPENPGLSGSLKAVMALYWRVRTIQFICTLGTVGTQVLTYRSEATEEKDLVCETLFAQATPNPYSVGCDTFKYYFYLPGTLAYLFIFLESPGAEIFIGGNQSESLPFSIGATGLSALMNWGGQQSSLTSIQCTEFWSYGGTYDTSTGSPL
jgi:hypothetical protein